jgi:hypothetical protein
MKTEEDEAFDELAKRQGDWGGGYQAKRKMAADKLQENVPLYASKTAFGGWREFASDYERGFIDGMQKQAQSSVAKAVNQMAQPAQEPIYKITVFDNAHPKGIPLEDWAQPAQRPWVGLTDDELADLWYKELLDWMEFARAVKQLLKEKNNG